MDIMRLSSILAALLSLLALALPAIAQERPNTILVLDGSGSMWGQIDGVNKIVIARQVVAEILAGFPADQNLGLVTYGHRRRGDCADIETLVAPAPGTAAEIVRLVNELNPRGMTPMADSVVAAAQSLRHTEAAATVILVSDGIETCNPDPCAAARVLAETGVDFTAHVVGFDVAGEAEALGQMQCIAEATGGLFLTADNAEELTTALKTVVATMAPQPEPEPEMAALTLRATLGSEDGPEVTDPVVWNIAAPGFGQEAEGNPVALELEAGAYEITGYHVVFEQMVTVQATLVGGMERTLTVVFDMPAPKASLVAPDSAPAGSRVEVGWSGPDEGGDNVQVAHVGGSYITYAYTERGNPVELEMPAEPGVYELRYSFRDREVIATRPIEVLPGQ
jgi:Ca-activated chloride channel family protein